MTGASRDDPTDADGDGSPFAVTLPPRPYPGLRPFDEAEWPIFFGRERMVDAVVTRLVGSHFVAVHGDSGSGKSSLIRAGVLPRLRQEQARGGARWRTCIALPRGGPLRQLTRALAALDSRGDDAEHLLALRRALNLGRRAPAALAELLLRGDDDHLCLLIDQFEELFEAARGDGAGEARLLTDALVAMAEAPPPGLYVALTMRSEYLGACARFPGFAEAVNVHQYLLPPMTVADLVRAIREPAGLYGGDVDAALAERLAADAGGIDGLPLVQHALMLLHREHGGTEPWRLTLEQYPAEGLAAQLSQHADAVAREVRRAAPPPGDERLVEDIFRALSATTAEGHAVRRPQTLAQLQAVTVATPERLAAAVDAFRADGVSFLTPRSLPGEQRALQPDDTVDIGHEALIRGWSALADPKDGWLVREFANGMVWRSLLVQADSFERDPGNVLSPATTEERTTWLARRNAAWAERYGGGWDRIARLLDASRQRRDEVEQLRTRELESRVREQRAQRRLWAVLSGSVLVLGLAGVAGWQWRSAEQARDKAKVEAAAVLAARTEAEAKNAALEQLVGHTRSGYEQVVQQMTELRHQALTAPSWQALRDAAVAASERFVDTSQQIRQATRQAEVAQTALPAPTVVPQSGSDAAPAAAAAPPSPVVYIQFGDYSQADAARAFQRAVQRLRLGGVAIDAPGTELVKASAVPQQAELRCFRAAECRNDGPRLLAELNALLDRPKLVLKDLSARYENSKEVRRRQFEVWFAAGEVRLAGGAAEGGVGRDAATRR